MQRAAMVRAARCNPPRSVLRSPPQRTAIFHTAYSNFPHGIPQSSHNVLQFFTLHTAVLYTAYSNLPHCELQFFPQHTAILHIACCNSPRSIQQFFIQHTTIFHTSYSNSSRSVQQSSTLRTAISSAAYRNLRLQPSDGHPKASDGRTKAANGQFIYTAKTFSPSLIENRKLPYEKRKSALQPSESHHEDDKKPPCSNKKQAARWTPPRSTFHFLLFTFRSRQGKLFTFTSVNRPTSPPSSAAHTVPGWL